MLFPFHFLLLAAIFFIAGLGIIMSHPYVSGILILFAAVIVTAYEGTEIDPSSGSYREYNAFLFIKKGKRKRYGSIESIFVNAGKVSQKIYTAHTTSSSTFSSVEYNAYLKFGDGNKIFLFSDKNRRRLMRRLQHVAGKLNTSIVDNTPEGLPA